MKVTVKTAIKSDFITYDAKKKEAILDYLFIGVCVIVC